MSGFPCENCGELAKESDLNGWCCGCLSVRVRELGDACKKCERLVAELVDRACIGNDDARILREWGEVQDVLETTPNEPPAPPESL